MLLTKPHDPIQASGLGQGNTFTIAASAKAFEILSSNLYANKILAVIREISCNAADAHRLVDKGLSEIQIHLPTFGEPYFAVRDFGPGLSHSDVLHLYTSYFQSNKDSNNDLIGGFGLGSKSPFAVGDQFTVTSWHGGQRSDYVMYKSDGVPNVNTIRQETSSDPAGLEVRLAVPKDPGQWLIEASNFFSWWPEVPTLNMVLAGAKTLDPTNIWMQSDQKLGDYPEWVYLSKRHSSKIVVFMGLVPYTVDLSAIPNTTDTQAKLQNLGAGTLCLTFGVGDLSINPSRETLSYDAATSAAILKRLDEIADVIATQMQSKLDALPDMEAARKFVWGTDGLAAFQNVNSWGPNQIRYKWNGEPVLQHVELDCNGSKNAFAADLMCGSLSYRTSYRVGSNKWRKNSGENGYFSHTIKRYEMDGCQFVWMPGPFTAKTYRVVQHHFENLTGFAPDYNTKLHILAGSTFADVTAVLKKHGIPVPLDGSQFAEPPKQVRSRTAQITNTQAYVLGQDGNWNRDETQVDLKGGGLWISFFDGSPDQDTLPLKAAVRCQFVTNLRAVGFRRSKLTARFKATLAANGWFEYDPATWWHHNISEAQVKSATIKQGVYDYKLAVRPANMLSKLAAWMPKAKVPWDVDLWSAAGDVSFATSGTVNMTSTLFAEFPQAAQWFSPVQIKARTEGETKVQAFKTAMEAFLVKHPMLRHVDWSYSKLDLSEFECYIQR